MNLIEARATITIGVLAFIAATLVSPSGAGAASCSATLLGGPSAWTTLNSSGEFGGAVLLTEDPNANFVVRDNGVDSYARANLDGIGFSTIDFDACSRQDGGQELVFPRQTMTLAAGQVRVRPKLYVHPRRPFARLFTTLTNSTDEQVTFTFSFTANSGADNNTVIGTSSNGDATANEADRWATSCEDVSANGCSEVVGESQRDPELAHNWEGQGGNHSADRVEIDGDPEFEFDGIRLAPGKTKAFMQVITLAPTILAANKAAVKVDTRPNKAGVFTGLSKKERQRLQNW